MWWNLNTANSGDRVVEIGHAKQPTAFVLWDHRLRIIREGLTPATFALGPGFYEVVVRNDLATERATFAIDSANEFDGSTLGLPTITDVPIGSALHRDHWLAEKVSLASGSLRDQSAAHGSGLVMVIVPPGGERKQDARQTQLLFQLLDTAHRPLSPMAPAMDLGPTSATWHCPLPAGGYVVRFQPGDTEATFEIPIWLPAGYQLVMFVPVDQTVMLDRVSMHMIPLTWVWTGFDFPTRLLEVAVGNLRKGLRPFGAGRSLDFTWEYLSVISPLLGIIRLYDLAESGLRHTSEFVVLAQRLQRLVPGHPDLSALGVGRRLDFPPTFSRGYDAILNLPSGPEAVGRGTMLEASFASRVQLGVYSTWRLSDPGIRPDDHFASVRVGAGRTSPIISSAIKIGRAAVSVLLVMLAILIASVFIYRFFRMSSARLVHALETAGGGPAEKRVARYLADLAIVGEVNEVRLALAGLRVGVLAQATNLPARMVDDALRSIRRDLWRGLRSAKA